MSTPLAKKTARAFVIGGIPSFVDQTIRKKLARYGIEIPDGWHLSLDRLHHGPTAVGIPAECELLVVLYDMVPTRAHADPQRKQAEAMGIPILEAPRKIAQAHQRLLDLGFDLIAPDVAAALSETHEAPEEHDMMKDPEKKPVTAAVAAPYLPTTMEGRLQLLGALVTAMRDTDNVDGIMWSAGSEKIEVTQRRTLSVNL
jgi:hypothetical protein